MFKCDLQVYHNITVENPDGVAVSFENFNKSFYDLERIFKEVTGVDFKPGQKFDEVAKENILSIKN